MQQIEWYGVYIRTLKGISIGKILRSGTNSCEIQKVQAAGKQLTLLLANSF